MPSYEPIDRAYRHDDLTMLEMAQVFHDNFLIDQVAFMTAFPKFSPPYDVTFQTEIDNADAIPPDLEVKQQITYLTEQIDAKVELGAEAMQVLFVYVKVAFPNSQAMLNTFGKREYTKSRNNDLKMKELLEKANRQAEETDNKTALIDAGYTQANIDELKSLSDEIDALNSEQEYLKSERLKKTEDRIIQYNKVWAYMDEISEASKVVFRNSPAKLAQYLLYPGTGGMPGKVLEMEYDAPSGMLSWDEPQSSDPIIEYKVERSGDESNWTNVYEGAVNQAVVPLLSGANYFRCRARNKHGWGNWSDNLEVNVGGIDAPSWVNAVYSHIPGGDKVTEDQVEVTYANVAPATMYEIWRSIVAIGEPAGAFMKIADEVSELYLDFNLTMNTRCYYYIIAKNATERSEPSVEAWDDVENP